MGILRTVRKTCKLEALFHSMSQLMLALPPHALQQHAQDALEQQQYALAAFLYEQLMEADASQISHVWYLGLARLLAGNEAEAQLTWMMAMAEGEPEQVEAWSQELVQILLTEAERQESLEAWQLAWAVRQHVREIAPLEIHNLLHILRLSLKLNLFSEDFLEALGVIELLNTESHPDIDQNLLLKAVEEVFEEWFEDSQVSKFAEAAIQHISKTTKALETLVSKAFDLRDRGMVYHIDMARHLAELCLTFQPNNPELYKLISICYESAHRHADAIAAARKCLALYETLDDKMIGMAFLAIRCLRDASCWQETKAVFEQQQALMPQLFTEYTPHPERPLDPTLLTFCSFYPYYLDDAPAKHRQLQNQLAALLQTDAQFQAKKVFDTCQKRLASPPPIRTDRKLRIGYIARYMTQHPVGWLARWLMQYHDRDRFDIYTYHLHQKTVSDFTNRWFVRPATRSARFEDGTWVGIADHICQNDEIDILIEMDSITYSETCSLMALKPAPIQVSWMGFDASGIPAMDYFIADPYVLPEAAQDYYHETIWRLPNTYLAVDGFEIGVPNLRRDQLDIPADATIYFSSQDGKKRHPDTMRLQVRILREVPNSYLLIKGIADEAALKEAFEQVAEEEGVSRDRLRFLPLAIDEFTHRANLGIADVVLDTYPYNGATTTLETLWMGVPIVTRVGQQWAARNSYTMLMNVGVTEGIAWTDEEYVEWGVRLGQDAALRHQIHHRLMQSRQTSPLWNTRQFAREMETAYEQMWQKYLES